LAVAFKPNLLPMALILATDGDRLAYTAIHLVDQIKHGIGIDGGKAPGMGQELALNQ
jgi:hypothetical protein